MVAMVALLYTAAPAADDKGAKVEAAKTIATKTRAIQGSNIKLHYTLTVEGKVVDSSKGKSPLEFQLGASQVIPGFENAVTGMEPGQKKSFAVAPKDGYGLVSPLAVKEIPKAQFPPELKPEIGEMLYFQGSDGRTKPVKVLEVKADVVVMDFNHPLAGKTLNFDIELVEVR